MPCFSSRYLSSLSGEDFGHFTGSLSHASMSVLLRRQPLAPLDDGGAVRRRDAGLRVPMLAEFIGFFPGTRKRLLFRAAENANSATNLLFAGCDHPRRFTANFDRACFRGGGCWHVFKGFKHLAALAGNWRQSDRIACESFTRAISQAFQSMHPAGVEPTTFGFGGQRSIQLSYGCLLPFPNDDQTESQAMRSFGKREMGSRLAGKWQAEAHVF